MRTNRFVLAGILVSLFIHAPNATAQTASSPQMGYIRVTPDNGATSPAGLAIFGFRSAGNLIGEAGEPAGSTVRSGRIFVEISATVNSGIAFANPNSEDATINYYFTDSSGHDFGGGVMTLPANHQTATYLTDAPFSASPLTGTFTFSSSASIAALGLRSRVNERSEVLVTTVPVSPLGSSFGGTTLMIPQFPTGATWTTEVVLINPGDTSLSGTVRFLGSGSNNGSTQSTNAVVNGNAVSNVNYTILPRSAFQMVAQAAPNSGQVSQVLIVPASGSDSPSSVAIFSYQTGGITVSEASAAALPASQSVRLYVETAGVLGAVGSIQTGVNISNPSSTSNAMQMNLMNLDGTPTSLTSSLTIPGSGQVLKFANDLFPSLPSTFKGVMIINGQSPLVVEAVRDRYNERGDLLMTTTPVYDNTSVPALETVFPHFVSGAGYWTQLILLSTGGPQSGSLTMLSQDGTALPPTILQPNRITGTLKASYLGVTGQDYVGGNQLIGNGVPDWHIQLQGLRGTPVKVQITSTAGGLWEIPYNGANWVIVAQYGASGSGDLWFEPWSTPGFHVKVWYTDSTTDEADATAPSAPITSTLKASYQGVTGQDYVGPGNQLTGVPDWHIQLQGLRGTPVKVRITSTAGGLWETPYNGANWVILTQYGASGSGDLWFEPWSTPGFHVKVWYTDSTTDEADAS